MKVFNILSTIVFIIIVSISIALSTTFLSKLGSTPITMILWGIMGASVDSGKVLLIIMSKSFRHAKKLGNTEIKTSTLLNIDFIKVLLIAASILCSVGTAIDKSQGTKQAAMSQTNYEYELQSINKSITMSEDVLQTLQKKFAELPHNWVSNAKRYKSQIKEEQQRLDELYKERTALLTQAMSEEKSTMEAHNAGSLESFQVISDSVFFGKVAPDTIKLILALIIILAIELLQPRLCPTFKLNNRKLTMGKKTIVADQEPIQKERPLNADALKMLKYIDGLFNTPSTLKLAGDARISKETHLTLTTCKQCRQLLRQSVNASNTPLIEVNSQTKQTSTQFTKEQLKSFIINRTFTTIKKGE